MGIAFRLVFVATAVFETAFHYLSWQNAFFAVLGIAPTLLWLTFFLSEERRKKKEPKFMISLVFTAGAVSALVSLILQVTVRSYLISYDVADTSLVTLGIFAFIEEICKFSLVYLVMRWSKFFDEPIDGMLNMITGALGFAAFENMLFVISAPDPTNVIIFRFIGAILLHAIASGFIGFHWMRRNLLYGIAVATALHLAFNVVVLYTDELIFAFTGNIVELGVILGPFMLVIVSFFLFRDFDIIKKQ